MQIVVKRKTFTDTATLGEMFIDGVFTAYTLEDKDRWDSTDDCDCSKKVNGETCIPYGQYKAILSHSAHFGKDLPHILDVPCFEGIRIHSGNTDIDTDGCVLIGAETNNTNRIWNCAGVLSQLIEKLQGVEDCSIEIMNGNLIA